MPLIALLLLLAQVQLPSTPVREVTDTHFGQTVVDPYRWMEKNDTEFMGWLRAQDAYTRSVLGTIPGREQLAARLKELDNAVATVSGVQRAAGDHYFYFKSEPGAETRKLYMRKGLRGPERLLVDPASLGSKERHAAIDHYAASLDGKYVAYGVSTGGTESSVLRVIETATGRILPDEIDRTRFAHVSWLPDNRSFFYWRSNKLPEGAPPSEAMKRTRTYLHVLGSDPDGDRPIFGYGLSSPVELTDIHYPLVAYTPGSPYLLAVVARGVKNEVAIAAAPLSALKKDPIPWKVVAREEDQVTRYAAHGDDLYLLTHRGAPRYKLLRLSLANPDLAFAETVVDAGEAVMTEIATATDALYLQLLDGGLARIKRLPYAKGEVAELPLPFEGAIQLMVADPRFEGALVNLTSWTHSPVWLRYLPRRDRLEDTGLQQASPVDFSNYESRQVKVRSSDGTLVPLSIVAAKGLRRDGSHPTLLTGYGAYGTSVLPSFDPKRLAWLERGGVLAFAHVRGGGEYGEEWHRAGQKKTKMNSIDDFIACAESLIAEKFTSASKLGALGGSAGGILVGRAMTKRPDLFAAVVSRVGSSNPLRLEVMMGGPQNTVEFGTTKIQEEFEGLRAMDPYVNVAPQTRYPAVMLTASNNDPRIPSWQPGKMAARLQAASISEKPVLLRVDFEAGHGGLGMTRSQLREELTDIYAFLLWQFGSQTTAASSN